MTYDYRERSAASADMSALVRKYMTILGLDVAPVVKVGNSLGTQNLGACKWTPGKPTSTIVLQKIITGDPKTLERIFAHEMAHHAVFLEYIRAINELEAQHGPRAAPYVRTYVRNLRRSDAHGEGWLKYVKIINAHMGADFVTKKSDESYVQDAETKPYVVLIAPLPMGKYGYQIGVKLSTKMKEFVDRSALEYKAKLIQTTDPMWQHGPRIGGLNWATSPNKQEAMHRLYLGA